MRDSLREFQAAVIARRVVSRYRVEAGLFDGPPAMYESIMEWIEAVLAANNIKAAQADLDDLSKPGANGYQAGLDKLLKAAQVFKAERTWKNYKVLDEAQGIFGAHTRWSIRDFQKMTDEKHAELERRADAVLEDLRERTEYFQRQNQERIKAAEAKVRDLRQYTKSGVKPMDSDTILEDFAVDLKGWKYDTPAFEKALFKQVEQEKGSAREFVKKLEDREERSSDADELLEMFRDQARRGIGYRDIKVLLSLVPNKTFGANWAPAMRRITVYIPKVAGPSEVVRVGVSLRHELRHFGQSYLSYALGKAWDSTGPGFPSKKLQTPQYRQQFHPDRDGPKDDPDQQRIYQKLKNKGIDPRKVDWHSLDDVEFYTNLADSIGAFEKQWPRAKADGADLRGAVKLWTASVIIRQRDLYDRKMMDKALKPIGGIETYRNFNKPNAFFLALRKRASGKWRKAVSEFVKAVT